MQFNRSSARPDKTVTVQEALDLAAAEKRSEANPPEVALDKDSDPELLDDVRETSKLGGGLQATEEARGLGDVEVSDLVVPSEDGHVDGLPPISEMPSAESPQGDGEPQDSVSTPRKGEAPARSPSPSPTEIVADPPKPVVPFVKEIAPWIIARDYAFHPQPIPPAPMVFPILATYIWFHYNHWRVIKQMPRILINAWQSSFIGCDLVYLIHFNWVNMKEISWLDAREWLGQGLLYLYEHPRDVKVPYGTKRPSIKAPFVRKWFSKFNDCKTLEFNSLDISLKRQREYEKGHFRFYGPFGEAMHRYFPAEETAVFWPLYDYLLGKGPKPQLSETMEKVFEPILHCRDGSAGGRGKPFECPRDKTECEPREGTEPEDVDIVDPNWFAIECTKVPAFAVYRKELSKKLEKALIRRFRDEQKKAEEEAAAAKTTKKRKKGKANNWTRKKSRKTSEKQSKVAAEAEAKETTDVETKTEAGPSRRTTRSMAKAAGTKVPENTGVSSKTGAEPRKSNDNSKRKAKTVNEPVETEGPVSTKTKGKGKAKAHDKPTAQRKAELQAESIMIARRDKGKGKAEALPSSDAETGSKRQRDEDDEQDFVYEEVAPSEPGPSSRPMRRIRRRVRSSVETEPPTSKVRKSGDTGVETQGRGRISSRGTKRRRSTEPESDASESDEGWSRVKRRRVDNSESSKGNVAQSHGPVEETDSVPESSAAMTVSVQRKTTEGQAAVDGTTLDVESTSDMDTARTTVPAPPHQRPPPVPQPAPQVAQPQVNVPPPPPHAPVPLAPHNALPRLPHIPTPLRRCETTFLFGKLLRTRW